MDNLILKTQGFTIFNFFISWYGIIISFAMIMGLCVAFFICKKKNYRMDLPIDLALFALPFAIIGARIYYCIFNGVESFSQIFRIWEGGMAIYGGVIGGFLGIVVCCAIKKEDLIKACDLAAPCLILGQAIGRIGCYFAGCCYGIETINPALQFFPMSVEINGVWHLSTFFYESFFDLISFIILLFIALKTSRKGITTSCYLIFYGVIRAVLEQFRDPSESLTLLNTNIRVSQALSILLIILGVVTLALSLIKRADNGKV